MSKYYRKSDGDLRNLPIERIQAFSQLYFFSNMIESEIIRKKLKIDYKVQNIWHQYPTIGINSRQGTYKHFVLMFRSTLFRIADLTILLFESRMKNRFEGNKYEVVIVGSRRHLDEMSRSIIDLSKRFKVLVVGKIDVKTRNDFDKEGVDFLDVPRGSKFFRRWDRVKTLFKFLITHWKLHSPIKNNDIHSIFKSREWKNRLWYMKLMLFPEIDALYKLANEVLSTAKPAVVITTSSNDTFGASIALAALAQKIKVAELQHGFFKIWDYEWEFCNCDFFLVWGEESKKVKRALVPRLYMVGLPFSGTRFKSQLVQKNKQKNKRLLFLWCPAYGSATLFKSELANETFSKIIKAFSGFPQTWGITIRTHPSYALSGELQGLDIPANIKISDRESVESAIDKSDVVITQATTAGLVAITRGKPLLFFDNTWLNKKLGNPYVKSGSAINIPESSLDNLYSCLVNFLNDKEKMLKQRKAQKRFVKQAIYKTGKGSTAEIEKFVEGIINKLHTA